MNAEHFKKNFSKVYASGNKPIFVSKAAHNIKMLSTSDRCDFTIGFGIAPDTRMGIMPTDDNMFIVRFSDTEMQYECRSDKLSAYTQKDRAMPVFQILSKFESIPFNGAKLYFECETGFEEYETALIFGIASILGSNTSEKALLKYLYNPNSARCLNALISFSASKNRCTIVENGKLVHNALPLDGCNVVLGRIKSKQSELNKHSTFTKNERTYFESAKSALNSGMYSELSRIIRHSSTEYLASLKKNSNNLNFLFNTASKHAIICGLYGQCGIYAIVEEEKTNEFIKKIGCEYEKECGCLPFFFVCASASTGME